MRIAIVLAAVFGVYCAGLKFLPGAVIGVALPWLIVGGLVLGYVISRRVK